MKRLFLLCLALLLCIAPVALAEDALPVVTSFPDFTLRTAQPLTFQGEKADGQSLFLFYSSAEAGVTMTAVNAVWTRRTDPFTPEAFTSVYQAMEDLIRVQYESGGASLTGFEVTEAVEQQLWDLPALVCDAFLTVCINDTDVNITQRGICVTGPFGTYLFTLSAWSPDLLEEATDALVQGLGWKEGSTDYSYPKGEDEKNT